MAVPVDFDPAGRGSLHLFLAERRPEISLVSQADRAGLSAAAAAAAGWQAHQGEKRHAKDGLRRPFRLRSPV